MPNILYYAIGDCVPGQALAHVASAEGIICVEKIEAISRSARLRKHPWLYHCPPEVASVGLTEDAAKEAGEITEAIPILSFRYAPAGHKDGFVLIFDAKGELLGGHMIVQTLPKWLPNSLLVN